MNGLVIQTVTGKQFTVYGNVTYRSDYDVYYCAGESFPSEIVKEVLEQEKSSGTAATVTEASANVQYQYNRTERGLSSVPI